MPDIRLIHVKKQFKQNMVLNDLNFMFEEGKVYGIVGQNGCGKSVLFKIIAGLMRTTSGDVVVGDKVIGKNGQMPVGMGILIENPGFLPELTGIKNLEVLASIRGIVSREQMIASLHMVGLQETLDTPVKKYSLGMLQRLGIAQALMEEPNILLLDEPFNGIDQEGVNNLRNRIKEYAANYHATILLSSHNRNDIEYLCDEILHIDRGKFMY